MKIRLQLWVTAATLALLSNSSAADTGNASPPARTAGLSNVSQATGILTDRLTARQLQAWRSIRDIVLARDRLDRPLYPTLDQLWHQAEACGHVIHIELSDRRCPICVNPAGSCAIERLDPAGRRHVLVIRLDLYMIDRAHTGELSRRHDGFIPFRGLTKEERYAEVFGHELAHAVRLCLDPDYLSIYQELKLQAIEHMNIGGFRADWHMRQIERRQLLEGVSEAAEIDIWRELLAGRRPGRSPLYDDSRPGRITLHDPGADPRAGSPADAGK